MAKKHLATDLLLRGMPPTHIARQLGLRHSEVLTRLHASIGEGRLRRSDIAFALARDLRRQIDTVIAERGTLSPVKIAHELQARGMQCHPFDIKVYLDHRRAQVVMGDMYEMVRNIELRLHRFLRAVFVARFGEDGWWRGGVPDRIRAECAMLLEKDPEPASEPYCYTHLIGLRETLDKSWSVVSEHLPKDLASNKRDLMERITRLNRIRNGVMHPVRGDVFTEDDFAFVHELESDIQRFDLNLAPAAQPSPPEVLPSTTELQDQLAPVPGPAETEAEHVDFQPSVMPDAA
jgi:hypothetical protein